MISYKSYREKVLQNSEVKAEYDRLQLEYDIIQAMIDAIVSRNINPLDLFVNFHYNFLSAILREE